MVKGKNKKSEMNPSEAMTRVSGSKLKGLSLENQYIPSETITDDMKEVAPEDQAKGILFFVNGKRISADALKSFFIQHSDGMTVIEVNYEEEQKKDAAKKADITTDEKPSSKGISIPKSEGPEVYALGEDDFIKLCSMSALRTDKTDDKGSVSKLKKNIPNENILEYIVEEIELKTDENDIADVLSITKALNDLAVKEQKIQRNPKVLKVEEVYSRPKVVFTGNTFILIERLKIYKVKESNEK